MSASGYTRRSRTSSTKQAGLWQGVGRIPIVDVQPVVDAGRWATKAVTGEPVPISATIFREGHDAMGAQAVLLNPKGRVHARVAMHSLGPGMDRYEGVVIPDATGNWAFRVEAYSDPYATWDHAARVKIEAGVDEQLMLDEGAALLERALTEAKHPEGKRRLKAHTTALEKAVLTLRDGSLSVTDRLSAGISPAVQEAMAAIPLRELVTASPNYTLRVQRPLALFSAWYEFFPRSEGAVQDAQGTWTSGNFITAQERLPYVADLGFDIVYLPPIHPIGEVNRKGPNNTLTPAPGDPGSPWAIGSKDGGHDAIHPNLGSVADFEAFVAAASELGLSVALDLALQCAPDHPWVREHPQWFTSRVDGTIAYAENPPKKYQDIYPLNFDNDPEGIYAAILEVVLLWVGRGVTVFRVDNPHTKPVSFWERLIAEVNDQYPDVIFLAEAFTRPAMMHTLAKAGFQQSYTYFTWRNSKDELAAYVSELATHAAHYMVPNFWPNTPDILPEFLQYSGLPGFKLRAALAALLSPSWGMYAGFELGERMAVRAGSEEYLDSEKYQYKPRDWAAYAPGGELEHLSIAGYIGQVNQIRRSNPALQFLRNTVFHSTEDDAVLCFSRRLSAEHSPTGRENTLVVVANMDPHNARETMVHLDLPVLGLDWGAEFTVRDLITDSRWQWGQHNFVRLTPSEQPVHILLVG